MYKDEINIELYGWFGGKIKINLEIRICRLGVICDLNLVILNLLDLFYYLYNYFFCLKF